MNFCRSVYRLNSKNSAETDNIPLGNRYKTSALNELESLDDVRI